VNVGTKPKLFCCFSIRNCSKRDFITVPATIYICVQKTAACPTRHFISLCVCIHYRRGGPLKLNRHINPLNSELNPICYLLALLGAHHFLHLSRIRVKLLTFRLLMSYIYMEHPFLMFLDHTQRRSTVGRTPLDE